MPDRPVEAPPAGEHRQPGVLGSVSRRWWVIVGALTIVALWIALAGWPFDADAPRTPRPAAAASNTPVDDPGDATPTGRPLRRGNEVLTIDGRELAAVDPESGESRILLDLGAAPEALPTAVVGELLRGGITSAAWSADGRWVALGGRRGGLWVLDAEMEIRRLARAAYAGWMWSPTAAQLAMIVDSTLTVVDARTGRTMDVGEAIGDVTSAPVWSPDGTQILFGARGGLLYSVNVQEADPSFLVGLPGEDLDSMDEIEWSPDGAHIAVMNDLAVGGGRLHVMNADGSGVRVLLDDYEPAGLSWSPDGASLAFAGREDTHARLWTIPGAEGSPSTVVTGASIENPVWSPDGSRIGFAASTAEGPRWFAVDPGGVRRGDIDELTYLSWLSGSAFPS
jgi:hypothetical protein